MRLLIIHLILLLLLSACGGNLTPTPQDSTQFSSNDSPSTVAPDPVNTEDPILDPTQTHIPIPTHGSEKDELDIQARGLQPDYEGDIQANQNLTYYFIDVKVDLDPGEEVATLEGVAQMSYTNASDMSLDEFVLMLWPNNGQYLAEMIAGPITIDGRRVEHQLELEGLALRVPLNPELHPGESIEVNLPFSIRTEGSISNQRKRFGITNGVLMAPTFYPLIPRFVDGEWQAEIPPVGGDTTNSEVAYFQVAITASSEFEIIASGVEIDREYLGGDQQKVTFVTGPMRDFAFALGVLEKRSRVVDGTSLNAWVLPWHSESGERLLNAAAQQMEFLVDLVGPYPYVDLDIVDTPCSFGGIEYPGLVYICSVDDGYFVDTTVHEIAHQWFYGLIGNDQLYEPWLDESIASYWQVLYYENTVGVEQAIVQLNQFRSWITRPEDQKAPIGLGIEDYRLIGDYYTVVYFKGALFFDALRSELGDDVFFDFLKTYYQKYRYGFVDTQGFHETAEEVCGCDLDDLFNLWVYVGGDVSN